MKCLWLFFPLMLVAAASAQARVFDINKDSAAPYFLVSGGGSQVSTSAVEGEGNTGVTFTGGVNYNYTGEFGFLYSRSAASLRFGFEVLKPTSLETTASDTTSELYTATSELLGYIPKITLELNLHKTGDNRSFVAVSAGSASITMKNAYVLTAAGQAAYPGVVDHDTESKASSTLLAASLGYEGLLTDTTTILIEFGYRQLKFDNFKYSKDVTTFSGAKVSGDSVLLNTGLDRTVDFGGGFIALGFRFYF